MRSIGCRMPRRRSSRFSDRIVGLDAGEIVGRIVELLGGEIELASPTAGTGLVVRVTLPFTSAHSQVRPAA